MTNHQSMEKLAGVIENFDDRMRNNLGLNEGGPEAWNSLNRTFKACCLKRETENVDKDGYPALLEVVWTRVAKAPILAGWLVTTDGVFWCDGGTVDPGGTEKLWCAWPQDRPPRSLDSLLDPASPKLLEADLALGSDPDAPDIGLRVTHLGRGRWRVETLTESRDGDACSDSGPCLAVDSVHYSLLRIAPNSKDRRRLWFRVYWQDQPVEGRSALPCLQPVTARFMGFKDAISAGENDQKTEASS